MTRAVQIAELGDQNIFTVDGDNNRVGIASSSPETKLDVNGTIRMSAVPGANTNADLKVLFQTSTGTIDGGSGLTYNPGGDNLSVNGNFINLNTFRGAGSQATFTSANGAGQYDFRAHNDSLRFIAGINERMRIKTDGTLAAIKSGTHITNAEQTVAVFQRSSASGTTSKISIVSGNGASSHINFGDTDDEDVGQLVYDHSDNSMQFLTNTSEKLRIDSSGRLVIGASSAFDGGSSTLLQVLSTGGARIALGRNDTTTAANDSIGRIRWYGNDSDGNYDECARIEVIANADHASNSKPSALTFHTTAASAESSSERLRIDSSGNVGINRTAPDNQLSIGSNASFHTDSNSFYLGSNFTSTGSNFIGTGRHAQRLFFNNASGNGYLSYSNTSSAGTAGNAITWEERMRIGSDGKVYFGDFSSVAAAGYIDKATSGSYELDIVASRSTSTNRDIRFFSRSNQESMRIDSSGRVGINTSSPSRTLVVAGSDPIIRSEDTDTGDTYAEFKQLAGSLFIDSRNGSSDGTIIFRGVGGGSATEKLRITSGGHLLLGQNTTQIPGLNNTTLGCSFENLGANGGAFFASRAGGAGYFVNRNSDGTVHEFRRSGSSVGSITVNTSATAFNTSSDYRLKENVVDIADGITRVKQLAPKRFNFIADADTTVDGFLAHEAQTVVPEAITGTHNEVDDDNNPVYQGIDQSKLVPLLTAALQEAITKIETLETQNSSLEARLTALEG